MKSILLIFFISLSGNIVKAQTKNKINTIQIKSDTLQIVEAACGQCKFNLKGEGCNLAVRIDGKAYFADGTKIDDHGDAHADDGFCNTIRKAKVSGSIVNNRFVATGFTLLPEEKAKKLD